MKSITLVMKAPEPVVGASTSEHLKNGAQAGPAGLVPPIMRTKALADLGWDVSCFTQTDEQGTRTVHHRLERQTLSPSIELMMLRYNKPTFDIFEEADFWQNVENLHSKLTHLGNLPTDGSFTPVRMDVEMDPEIGFCHGRHSLKFDEPSQNRNLTAPVQDHQHPSKVTQ